MPKENNSLVSLSLFAPPTFILLLPIALYMEPGTFNLLIYDGWLAGKFLRDS
jgi:hypothetical protein